MILAAPQALLLAIPIALVLWRRGLPRGPAAALRLATLACALLALARPQCRAEGGGRDVVVVVDRSASMPPGADGRAQEVIERLEQARTPNDRVGIVTVARDARLERLPMDRERFAGFTRELAGDATELGQGLERAAGIASASRETRVLVVSDGLDTGGGSEAAARLLASRGIPIDFKHLARPGGVAELAVERLDVPSKVRVDEPFQVSAIVRATRPAEASWILRRGGRPFARGRSAFVAGANRLVFKDQVETPGLAEYTLELEAASDAMPENDRARGVVRVEGPARVMVVRADGGRSAVVDALDGAGIEVEVTTAPPRSLEALEGVAAVVLENVPASALGEQGLQVLARFVREAGGGLVMTGGRRSFGEGGYHRSPLDEVLPVSMELREEQRKTAIALGLSLDRSGSMAVQTPEGVPKMKLAAEGAIAALRLLGRGDEAAAWLVDTEPHVLVPLTRVEEGLPFSRIASVQSEGGGIYIGVALAAAARELERSDRATRHLILFADAADSEEPADYRETLGRMRSKGITVSVIGLGKASDSDAMLLDEVARLGGGRLYFAERASELPRLFSQETITIARSAFVDHATPIAIAPDLARLGPSDGRAPPAIGGYNVTYLRPRANVALRTGDDEASPVLAFWNVGLGRAAALTAEADGKFTGELRHWDGYRSLLVRTVRHVLPGEAPHGVLAKVRREGRELHVTVETDDAATAAEARVTLIAGDGTTLASDVPLRREDAFTLGARLPVGTNGTYFPMVALGSEVLRVPPVALSYAPEFEPREPAEGRARLEALARITGGRERLDLAGIFTEAGGEPARRSIATWFAWAALVLALAEVTSRRLGFSWPARPALPRFTRTSRPPPGPQSTPDPAPPAPPPPEPRTGQGMMGAMDRARERAKRRLD